MASFSLIADVMVRGLDSFKKLAGVAEEVGDNADDASGALDSLRKKTKRAGSAAKKTGTDFELIAKRFRDMGGAGERAGDVVDAFQTILSGPFGVAVAGAVVGAGALVAGFKALEVVVTEGIATNKRYTEQVETLTAELHRTAAILGQVLLDVLDFGNAVDTSNAKVKDFNDAIIKDSTQIADAMRDVISFVLKGVKAIGNALLGIQALFKAVGTAIGGFAALATTALGAIPALAREIMLAAAQAIRAGLEELGAPSAALDAFFGTEAELRARLRAATSSADSAGRQTRAIIAGMRSDLGDIYGTLEAFNNTLDNVIGNINRARGQAARIRMDRPRDGAGGGGAAAAAPGAAPGDEMVFGVGEVEPVSGFLSTGETVAEFQARMDGYGSAIDDLNAKLAGLNVEQQVTNTLMFEVGKASAQLAADSFMQLGGSIAFAMGEMAAGASTLKDFGDTMADLAGQIAGSFGQLFVQMGAGFLLVSPGIGAGLIAAGLGLQVLSGALSGRGSGNRGGAGGRSAASNAGRDIAREISRSLRPSGDDGPMVTNIEVVIGGRSIQPEMVAIVDDIARQGRSRYLGRRMGV